MAMTMTEADAVHKLVRFIVSGELYAGQPESASAVAAKLVFLAVRAEKILQLNLPGNEETYAARLAALAPTLPGDQPAEAEHFTKAWEIAPGRIAGACSCGQWQPVAAPTLDVMLAAGKAHLEESHKPAAEDALRRALKEIDKVHIEWGGTDLDDVNQLELWERIGRALRKADVR